MENRILYPWEVGYATINIQNIERALGRPVPYGMFDMARYSDRILTPWEVDRIVVNIENMLRARNNRSDIGVKVVNSFIFRLFSFIIYWFLVTVASVLAIVIISEFTRIYITNEGIIAIAAIFAAVVVALFKR